LAGKSVSLRLVEFIDSNPEWADLGRELFADVEAYAARSSHRTGTTDDAGTVQWFASTLQNDGATVQVDPWTFPQWTADWSAELDGQSIDSLPLFYETVGSFGSNSIDIAPADHPGGSLTVKNRRASAEVPVLSRATLQIPGRYADRAQEVRARIDDARVIEGSSANVLASYGCGFHDAAILIATPLSGWFRCASERGTGISIARFLARSLAQRGYRVLLLGTSGHELFNVGLEHHLATHPISSSVRAIVHVGASVAARSHRVPEQLSESLYVTSNVEGVGANLGSIGFHQRVAGTNPKEWIGEGTRWCTLDRPLLSVAGMSQWFHTPEDTADRTTPELLAHVARSLLGDCLLLVDLP
jgi:hypothetical protein